MPLITITNKLGTYSDAIARRLETKLGLPLLTKDTAIERFLAPYMSEHEIRMLDESPRFFLETFKHGLSYREFFRARLLEWAEDQSAICLGFSSALLLGDHPEALHIDVLAPDDLRRERVAHQYATSFADADRRFRLHDRQYRRYVQIVYGVQNEDELLYHLRLNTGRCSVDAAVDMILTLYKDALVMQHLRTLSRPERGERFTMDEVVQMKNPSEIAFSRVLDMYSIDWRYEPKTYPVEYDEEGRVTMAFSPDFYLPRFDLYLELTVMNQRYTATKNRKARRVQALYPGLNVRVVYRRDFDRLVARLEEPDREHALTHLVEDPADYQVLFDEEAIQTRIDALAAAIDRDYPDGLVLVSMLKGSVVFLSDLMRRLNVPVKVDFIRVGSYAYEPGQTPLLRIAHDMDVTIYERDVLLIDDFVCTGFETNFVLQKLESREPRSLAICSLVVAPQQLLLPLPIRYSGFEVGFEHLIGYGLDRHENGRQLPFIAVVPRDAANGDEDNGNGEAQQAEASGA